MIMIITFVKIYFLVIIFQNSNPDVHGSSLLLKLMVPSDWHLQCFLAFSDDTI